MRLVLCSRLRIVLIGGERGGSKKNAVTDVLHEQQQSAELYLNFLEMHPRKPSLTR